MPGVCSVTIPLHPLTTSRSWEGGRQPAVWERRCRGLKEGGPKRPQMSGRRIFLSSRRKETRSPRCRPPILKWRKTPTAISDQKGIPRIMYSLLASDHHLAKKCHGQPPGILKGHPDSQRWLLMTTLTTPINGRWPPVFTDRLATSYGGRSYTLMEAICPPWRTRPLGLVWKL